MKNRVNLRRLLILSMLLSVLALAACDGDNSNATAEPAIEPQATEMLDEPAVVDTPLSVEQTPIVTEDVMEETPLATEEVMEETATATTEVMEEPTAAATEMMTDTTEIEPTEEVIEGTAPAVTAPMTDTLVTQAILASDLVGMDITNEEGEEVGEVSEILVNQDGTLQHILFDVGGFLGIGEKTVAVTADQFVIRPEDDMTNIEADMNIDDLTIFYTGTATDLEDLPAFDTDILDADGSVLREPDELDTESDFDPSLYTGQLQVSEFQDYNLLNTEDEDIGEVEDLIIDLSQNMVTYAVVDVGGFLGIAENSIIIPWEQLTLETDGDDETFRINADIATLEGAPLFDNNDWTYPLDVDWDADFHPYWDNR